MLSALLAAAGLGAGARGPQGIPSPLAFRSPVAQRALRGALGLRKEAAAGHPRPPVLAGVVPAAGGQAERLAWSRAAGLRRGEAVRRCFDGAWCGIRRTQLGVGIFVAVSAHYHATTRALSYRVTQIPSTWKRPQRHRRPLPKAHQARKPLPAPSVLTQTPCTPTRLRPGPKHVGSP